MIKVPSSPLTNAEYFHLSKGSTLHRVHLNRFSFSEFNPCLGGDTRFAPIHDKAGQCVPSLYAGATAQAAFHESIFHDVPATAKLKTVRHQDISFRTHSEIKTQRKLNLVELRNVPLSKWSISRRDLIESNAKLYKQTAAWAQEIHHSFPKAHGLIWTSRQCDPEDAYMFFGDRVQAKDFVLATSRLGTDRSLISEVRREGKRRGITIVI